MFAVWIFKQWRQKDLKFCFLSLNVGDFFKKQQQKKQTNFVAKTT